MQGSLMAVDTGPEIGGGPAYNMGTVLCTDGMPGLMRPNFPLSAHKDRVKTWPPFAVLSFLGPCPPTLSRKSQVFLGPPVFGLTGAFCLYQSLPPSLVRNAGSKPWAVAEGHLLLGFHSSAGRLQARASAPSVPPLGSAWFTWCPVFSQQQMKLVAENLKEAQEDRREAT